MIERTTKFNYVADEIKTFQTIPYRWFVSTLLYRVIFGNDSTRIFTYDKYKDLYVWKIFMRIGIELVNTRMRYLTESQGFSN